MESHEHVCKSCGNRFVGLYCNLCGEKVIEPKDRSFRSFLSGVMTAVTLADNKVVKTMWGVLIRPGFLSKEYAEGRRVNYLAPLSLFFGLNLVYFLFPVIQLFNASLKTQLDAGYGPWVAEIVARVMVRLNISDINSFALVYNQKTTALAKLMVMVFVIIASLPLNLFYSKRNRYFSDHVAYMVELACFNLFVNTIALTLITNLFHLGHYLNELSLAVLFAGTNLYFLLRSGSTFYHERGWLLVVKSVLMLLVLKLALQIYRAILFFVTIWSL